MSGRFRVKHPRTISECVECGEEHRFLGLKPGFERTFCEMCQRWTDFRPKYFEGEVVTLS